MAHPLVVIISASLSATLEKLLALGAGFVLSYPKFKLLSDKNVLLRVSKLFYFFFLPCFILQSFWSPAIELRVLMKKFYIIPILSIFMQVVQYCIGELVFFFPYLKNRRNVSRVVGVLAISSSSCTCISMIYVYALLKNSEIFSGIEDAKNYGAAFVSLFAIPMRIFFFIYSIPYLRQIKTKEEEEEERRLQHVENRSKRMKKRLLDYVKCIWKMSWTALISPPLVSVLVAVLIVFIPPVKNYIYVDPPLYLSGFRNTIDKFSGMIGIAGLITGANLGRLYFGSIKKEKKFPKNILGFFSLKHAKYWDLVKVVYVKLFLLPSIFLILIYIFAKSGAGRIIDEEMRPLIYFVVMIESAVPSMHILGFVINVYNTRKSSLIFAEIVFFEFLIAPFSITLFMVISLYLVCHLEKCSFSF